MSIWSKLIGFRKNVDKTDAVTSVAAASPGSTPRFAIVDVEVGVNDRKIHDIGAL